MRRPSPRRFPGLGGLNFGALFGMTTKLFDTVTVLSAAAAYAPVAAEDVQIDLAAIGADVTITFPAAGTTGQCIGLTLLTELAGSDVTFAGPVDLLVGNLVNAGDCQLFTWDNANNLWRLVSAFRAGFRWLNPFVAIVDTAAAPGDYLVIGAAALTITLPEAPPNGSYVGVNTATFSAVALLASGADTIQAAPAPGTTLNLTRGNESLILVYSGGAWYQAASVEPLNSFSETFTDADLVAGVLTINHQLGTGLLVATIYDNTGLMVQQAYGASLSSYAVQVDGGDPTNQSLVTFDAAILPLAGTWEILLLRGA